MDKQHWMQFGQTGKYAMQEFTLLTKANLMKVLRAIRSLLFIWLPGIVIAFLIGLGIFNTGIFDEEPLPEVMEITRQIADAANTPLPAMEDNALYALFGLPAADNQNMLETGRQLIVRYLSNRALGEDRLTADDYLEILNSTRGSVSEWRQFERCNPRLEFNCLETVGQSLTVNVARDQRLSVLLERYEEILQMRTFDNIADLSIGTPVPAYQTLIDLGQLRIADLYVNAATGEFLDHMAAETAFLRFILREGTWPLDKMVAASALWKDYLFLSEYMAGVDLSEEDTTLIASMLQPLTRDEMSLAENYLNEARQFVRWIDNGMRRESGNLSGYLKQRLSYYLTRRNAAKNEAYSTVTLPLLQMNELSGKSLAEAVRNQLTGANLEWGPLRCNSCKNYVASMHDLNGIISLLRLQLDIKESDPADVATVITNSAITNPYTGEPFDYNPVNGILSFTCLVEQFEGQCRVKISP